nr:unnamed protein product [Spirometra erinaceieuropaei]
MNFPRQVDYSRSGRPLRAVHNPSEWEAWAPGNAGDQTRLGQLGSSSTISNLPTPPPSRMRHAQAAARTRSATMVSGKSMPLLLVYAVASGPLKQTSSSCVRWTGGRPCQCCQQTPSRRPWNACRTSTYLKEISSGTTIGRKR